MTSNAHRAARRLSIDPSLAPPFTDLQASPSSLNNNAVAAQIAEEQSHAQVRGMDANGAHSTHPTHPPLPVYPPHPTHAPLPIHPAQQGNKQQQQQYDVPKTVRRDSIVSAIPPHPDFEFEDMCCKYRFTRYLGHGSYGHVCEAMDVCTGKRVAIKKICHVFKNVIDAKRLLRELRILRIFRHENIIELKDIVAPRADPNFDSLYIVFEFVDTDLSKLIRSNQFFTELHVKYLLYQLLIGAKYIGSAQVVHRDLKPANILVNEDCTLKICDFGLSRGIGPRHPSHASLSINAQSSTSREFQVSRQLTKHVVTRWYRAPELILLQQEYTTAIDMWSIGCIMGELMSMVRENAAGPECRRPLFPGGSCFPLSADDPMAYADRFDQLNVIFDMIGTPSPEDIENTKSEKARGYLRTLPPNKRQDLSTIFTGSSDLSLDLLSRFIEFSPEKRITVDEALAHPFLANVRDIEVEKLAEQPPISFEFEDVALTTDNIRALVVNEIRVFSPHFGTKKRSSRSPSPSPLDSDAKRSRPTEALDVVQASIVTHEASSQEESESSDCSSD